jgi:hypothetical protein
MNKELMERFAKEINYGDWPFNKLHSCIMDRSNSFTHFIFDSEDYLDKGNYQFVCTPQQYEDYIKQRNESSSLNTVTEAFKLLETLAKQSNYDINITSVGTIIYDETAEDIRGTPEQLYRILEAQINLRNLVKEVTGEQ